MSLQSPVLVIARNFAWCKEYDDTSFSGLLHERNVWDDEEYWILEWALYQLRDQQKSDREILFQVFRIFSYTFLLISCHFDTNDGFRISNRTDSQLYDLRERFQLVFEGFFHGDMPAPDSFDVRNPLLVGGSS